MMEGSVPVDRRMIADVYELTGLFPYFQSAHMLLLKGLQDSADVKFDKQLHDSSVYIADREVLYYFLKDRPAVTTPDNNEPDGKVTVDRAETWKDDKGEEYNNQQTVIESAKNSEDLISKIEEDEAISAGPNVEDKATPGLQGHSILIGSEADDEDPAGIILLNVDETDEEDEKIFYMDPGITAEEPAELLELDTEEEKSVAGEDKPAFIPGKDEQVPVDKRLLQSELIERFILENPRIEPNREKAETPQEDISKPFVEETGGLVTETLAKIYISQGYYSRAIDIYEKLSLKFPEKSSYFATQIEIVKELIKK